MITMKSNCEKTNRAAKKIRSKTELFLKSLFLDLKETGELDHMPLSVIMLNVLTECGSAFSATLVTDITDVVMLNDVDDKEKDEMIETLVDRAVSTSFAIIEDALPIDILSKGNIKKEDAAAVVDFVDALNAKKGTLQ